MSEDIAVEPKRRGRPPKLAPPAVPVTFGTEQYDLDRILESFLGRPEVQVMRQNGSYANVFARYEEKVREALAWEAQTPCPHCQGRRGYNPLTGVWIRSWNAANHEWIEGHHNSCKTLMVSPLERR